MSLENELYSWDHFLTQSGTTIMIYPKKTIHKKLRIVQIKARHKIKDSLDEPQMHTSGRNLGNVYGSPATLQNGNMCP
jgi:hypothetical protein